MKRKSYFTAILFFILLNNGLSQNTFYSFLGDSNHVDIGIKSIETFDGNYVIGGHYWSSNKDGSVLIKINSQGDTLWTKTFSDTSNYSSFSFVNLFQLADSGLISIYSITTQNCLDEILLIKTNLVGDTVWTKVFNNGNTKTDFIHTVTETPDNGLVVVGQSDYSQTSIPDTRSLIMKLDFNGDTLWTKTFKNHQRSDLVDIKNTPEGNLIICGTTEDTADINGYNGFYPILQKIDQLGNLIWIKYYDLPGFSTSRGMEISDDGYIIAGETVVNNQFRNYLLKTDTSGNVIWCKRYELAPFIGAFTKITKCGSSGFYFSENICDSTQIWNSMVIKVDNSGIPEWTRIFDGKPASYIYGISSTNDNGCLLTGIYADTLYDIPIIWFDDQDFLVIKIDSIGFANCHQIQSIISYDSLSVTEVFLPLEVSAGINLSQNPIIINEGYPTSNLCSGTGIEDYINSENTLMVFPNPASNFINILYSKENDNLLSPLTLNLFDSKGCMVHQQTNLLYTNDPIGMKLNFQDGLYVLQLFDENKVYYRKVIISNQY